MSDVTNPGLNPNQDWKPTPDPTVLTTEQLRREIASLESQIMERIQGEVRANNSRLNGMDKAQELSDVNLRQLLHTREEQIKHLKELQEEKFRTFDEKINSVAQQFKERDIRTEQTTQDTRVSITAALTTSEKVYNEKFESVAQQFRERDTRVEQTARDTKVAVDAALQAAKEATGEANKAFTLSINKSEAATTKQIDQLAAAFQTAMLGVGGQIGDVKDRVARIENLAVGRSEAENKQSLNTTTQHGAMGLWVAISVAITGIMTFILSHITTLH